jgi:WD40 repeat protein
VTVAQGPTRDDVFISYAREDTAFADRLCAALVDRGKGVWIDVEDIRAGASDWRANVWAGIEGAKVMVFVLTPDSLESVVCAEELARADELNKRIVPVLHRSVDDSRVPPALARPNWILARAEDDPGAAIDALVAAIELDEPWVEQHARFTQRTTEWLRHDRDASYLLRGSDLGAAERWLDDEAEHHERPTADQIAYITAGRRAAARRQRVLLASSGLALAVTTALAIVALVLAATARDRERTARAQAAAAQSIAALDRDPEESLRDALDAVAIRDDEPEARFALRRAVAAASWMALLRAAPRSGDDRAAPLTDAELAPDGRLVATGDEDGGVALWNLRTRRGIALAGHEDAINTVVFSPDSRSLVTASEDGTARIWDARTGRAGRVLDARSGGVWSATYGAGGRLVATATSAGAQIWDPAKGTVVARLPGSGEFRGTIHMSLDGRRALTPAGDDATLWNVATQRPVATLRGNGRDALDFTLFSAGGRRILTRDDAGELSVWASSNGRRIARLPRRSGSIGDLDISADGRRVVTAGADGVAEIRLVAAPRRVVRLDNGEAVTSVQFDPAGRHVVTADDVGVARVWSTTSGRMVQELRGHTTAIRRARFSADGSRVLTASDDGSARVWRARPRTPDDPRWRAADSTSFSPDSRRVLVVHEGRRGVWDTATGEVVTLDGGIYHPIDRLAWPCGRAAGCSPWSPDGRFVAGADALGGAVVWDAATGAPRRLGTPSGSVIGAAFSADGRRVVVVDGERPKARIWSLAPPRREGLVPSGQGEVLQSAQFVAGPLRVLTVDVLGRAQVSDPRTRASAALPGMTLPIAATASPDGRQLAIGTSDGMLNVFADARRAPRSRSATPGQRVNALAYDPSGATIATGGQKGTRIWDARTLASSTLQAPGGAVTSVQFSPDGGLVLIASGSVRRLWDRDLRRVVLELPRVRAAGAELSPDATKLVLAGAAQLEVRECAACARLDELVRRARSLLPRGS